MRYTSLAIAALLALAPPLGAQTMTLGMNTNWVSPPQVDGRFNDAMVGAAWWQIGTTAAPQGPPGVGAVRYPYFPAGYPGASMLTATGTGTIQVYFRSGNPVSTGNLIPVKPPLLYQATFTGAETYTFQPAPGPGPAVSILATDATTPLDNIQILLPGSGPGLYHPTYLSAISPFPVIRVMDSQGTVASKEVRWADRVTQYGWDLEALIDLANQTGRDIWICIPARVVSARGAPTDYPRELGRLINSRLDPARTVYLEYSDEVWNYGNPWWNETTYVTAQGTAEYSPTFLHVEYARLAHAVFNEVASSIDPTNGPTIRRVFARQTGNTSTIGLALQESARRGYKFDYLSGHCYWGFAGSGSPTKTAAAIKAAWTAGDQAGAIQQVDTAFRAGLTQLLGWLKDYRAYAAKFGDLRFAAYEGGPGGAAVLWHDPVGLQVMNAYVQSPLCSQMTLDALNALQSAGVDLMCYYSFAHPDLQYGAMRHINDGQNRQYRALRQYLAGAPPAVFLGTDSTTRGDWIGSYGSLGMQIAGAPAPMPQPPPPGASTDTTTPAPAPIAVVSTPQKVSPFPYTYQAPGATTDARAPQLPGGNRMVGAWLGATELDVDVPAPASGGLYQLSIYCLDWANYAGGITQTVTVVNGDTGAVLDSRSISGFSATPVYLRWVVEGHIKLVITKTAGSAAALSGVFIDPVPAP